MATSTENYNFKKPDESDFYDVADQNKNWDLADETLKNLDTPTFEDYTGSTAVPSATDAIDQIKSKGKLGTLLSNIKAAFKGACLIGHIVNNCVTDNSSLPLSAAQGKALMDKYTQLYSDLNTTNNNLSNYDKNNVDSPTIADCNSPGVKEGTLNGNSKNTPNTEGLTAATEGHLSTIFPNRAGSWNAQMALYNGKNPCVFLRGADTEWAKWLALATKSDLSDFVVTRQISVDVTIPNGSPYSTSTHDITCDIPSGYKYVGILRAWCTDSSCFVWNAYFRDEGKNAKINVSNLNGTQKNTTIFIGVLYAKIMI